MKIQEADAKSLLVAQGLPVPAWEVAHTVAEARAAAERLAGAPRRSSSRPRCSSAAGARPAASSSPGRRRGRDGRGRDPRDGHQGHHGPQGPRRAGGRHRQGVLPLGGARSGRPADPPHGLVRGRRRDRAGRGRATPRRSSDPRRPVPGAAGLRRRAAGVRIGLAAHLKAAVAIAKGLVRTMAAYDADLVEINPLAIIREPGRTARRRAARVPRREGHPRRLRARPSSRARGPARPRRGGPDGPRGARGRADASSSSTGRSAAWSTAPAWR